MRKPEGVIEFFLQPGEFYFGDRYTRMRTVLGSCVSLVFWHPDQLLGGMCHYLLPSRGDRRGDAPLDGRYGDEAIALMLGEIRRAGSRPEDFRVRIYGGGNMFPTIKSTRARSVGEQNVQAAHQLVAAHRLNCVSSHVEGVGHRHLVFDVWSGYVLMKRPVQNAAATTTMEK